MYKKHKKTLFALHDIWKRTSYMSLFTDMKWLKFNTNEYTYGIC